MKTRLLLTLCPCAACLFLSQCASFTPATKGADSNHDGRISKQEYTQFHTQRDIEDRAVRTETAKRENIISTLRDVRDSVGWIRETVGILRSF